MSEGIEVERSPSETYELVAFLKKHFSPYKTVEDAVEGLREDEFFKGKDEALIREWWIDAYGSDGIGGLRPLEDAEIEDMTIDDIIGVLENVESFPNREDYIKQIIWASHSHLIELFDVALYLGFEGRTGSGKSTATEISVAIAKDGVFLTDTTPAYLSNVLHEGKTIGTDELDVFLNAKKGEIVSSVFRGGYRRGAKRGVRIQQGNKWVNTTLELFGDKAFNFRSKLDSATMSRAMVIQLKPCDGEDIPINNTFLRERYVSIVKRWIELKARKVRASWDRFDLQELANTDDFRREVGEIKGVGRDYELGSILLATCHMLGWDFNSIIQKAIRDRKNLEEYELEYEVADCLINDFEPSGYIRTMDILEVVNQQRKRRGLYQLSSQRLATAFGELDIRRERKKIRGSKGAVAVIEYNEDVRQRLIELVETESSEPSIEALDSDMTIKPVQIISINVQGECLYCIPSEPRHDLIRFKNQNDVVNLICPEHFETEGFKDIGSPHPESEPEKGG